jgi:DNA-binding NarL/FixJ family response regulator
VADLAVGVVMTIALVLVTDSAVFAMGFEALFAGDQDVGPISVVTSPDDCLHLLRTAIPDVVVVDEDMEGAIGLCQEVSARWPAIPIFVLSTVLDDGAVRAAIDAGATGFVGKQSEADYLRNAVKSVADGQSVLDPRVTRAVISWVTGDHNEADEASERLSGQELQVLRFVARGESNKRIATKMGISENTVKTYLRRIYRKINCSTRSEAAAWLTRHGAF